jgi:hypothetical protein
VLASSISNGSPCLSSIGGVTVTSCLINKNKLIQLVLLPDDQLEAVSKLFVSFQS